MKHTTGLIIFLYCTTHLACSGESDSKLKETWNIQNHPAQLLTGERTYEAKFTELPLSGELSETPWSGDYWPTYKGGISYRWMSDEFAYNIGDTNGVSMDDLSPAEKFDLLVGDYTFGLTKSERFRTRVMKTVSSSEQYDPNFEIPEWEGLCHGWAPATLNFKEPNPVSITSKDGIKINFASSDIKALLTYYQQSYEAGARKNYILGERCNQNFALLDEKLKDGSISNKQYQSQLLRSQCRDTNAGAFHLVLANQIAIRDEGFLFDKTRDSEVWNQAVYSYHSGVKRVITDLNSLKVETQLAPSTVKVVEIATIVFYTSEIEPHWQGEQDRSLSEESVYYRYFLELDANDQIVGGSWISSERPDFLWKQSKPSFNGKFKALEEVYLRSTKK